VFAIDPLFLPLESLNPVFKKKGHIPPKGYPFDLCIRPWQMLNKRTLKLVANEKIQKIRMSYTGKTNKKLNKKWHYWNRLDI
jgi:hypothetical protein